VRERELSPLLRERRWSCAHVRNRPSYAASGGLADALIENESTIRDLISGIEGFRAYYFVRGDGDAAASVSVYDDRAGAEELNRLAAEWIAENVPDLSVSAPSVTAGEVALTF
jgi:hypothetical protein